MSQITLRGLDAEMEDKIRKMASNSGKSLNRVIIDMIYQHTGFKKKGNKKKQISRPQPPDVFRRSGSGFSGNRG